MPRFQIAYYPLVLVIALAVLLHSCTSGNPNSETRGNYDFQIAELDDAAYPDNPNIGFRASDYSSDFFESGEVLQEKDGEYTIQFYLTNGDTLEMNHRDFMEFMPSIPDDLRQKEYAAYIAVVNQEWNRNQVHFLPGSFKSGDKEIVRADLARNCLNAYLWEIIVYTDENGKTVPLAHGWFDFPGKLYAKLFEVRNDTSWTAFQKPLENWVDPESKAINPEIFGEALDTLDIAYADKSDTMYPLAGARLKKYKEIIVPDTFQTMRDLQSDSTLFATFSSPGFYNRADPRHTELGRIYKLTDARVIKRECGTNSICDEIDLDFEDRQNQRKTILRIGGIDLDQLPTLREVEANKGWKNSMGFDNHTFYESVEEHESYSGKTSPYFAYLSDEQNRWLDSHKVGIDGPVIYWDADQDNLLHVWLLSFERHAFVGHYEIQFKNPKSV